MEAAPSIDRLGPVLDVDAHEMAPHHLWGEMFGEAAAHIASVSEPLLKKLGANDLFNPSVRGDVTAVTDETVWSTRGVRAPGAFDFNRRVAVLDQMQIDKQLVFPSYVLAAMNLMESHPDAIAAFTGNTLSPSEAYALGEKGFDEYNEWAVRASAVDPDRLRIVAYLPKTASPDELVGSTKELLDRGIRAVHLNVGHPPGGRSPAHPDLDEFWAMLAERDVVCTVHVGGHRGFLASMEWINAPAFAPGTMESHEIGLEPYSFATMHLPYTNFAACMILGGVFERHPRLRFGMIEVGSAWFGPLVESLDMWARDVYWKRLTPFISRLPSEYAVENIRVTPFNNFERPDDYMRRYPDLQRCFCYSSDYPHVEGGTDSKRKMYEKVAPLGEEVVRGFFVENARLLFPT